MNRLSTNLPRVWRVLAAAVVAVAASVTLLGAGPARAAADTTPPTVPAGLTASNVSFTYATVTWNASTDNSGSLYYEVTINQTTGPYTQIVSDPTVEFGGLTAGQTYTVSVRAVDFSGNASASASTQFMTLARTGPPPTAPANVRGVFTSGILTGIAWDASVFDGHVSYQLFANGTWAWATSKTSVTVRELVASEGVKAGHTYTFTVQAIGADNYLSDLSAPVTLTIPSS
jgi:predicted phage tail protein